MPFTSLCEKLIQAYLVFLIFGQRKQNIPGLMQFANRNPQNHPTQGNSYHPQTSICRATHAWIYCVFSGSKKAGSRFAYTDRNLHRQNGVFMAISLSLDQKEKAAI